MFSSSYVGYVAAFFAAGAAVFWLVSGLPGSRRRRKPRTLKHLVAGLDRSAGYNCIAAVLSAVSAALAATAALLQGSGH